MREFKFIRGVYTNDDIFDENEKANCLIACDSEGDEVSLAEKNDDSFQKRFASESHLSEIYTLRQNQFEVEATRTGNGSDSYSLNFVINDEFPSNLKTKANTLLNSKIKAQIESPKLILNGANPEATSVKFVFNEDNSKNFTRDLFFRVTGELEERTYEAADGKNLNNVYRNVNDMLDGSNAESGTFKNGRRQTSVSHLQKTIAQDNFNITTGTSTIGLASKYTATDSEYKLKCGSTKSQFISYEEIIANGGIFYLEKNTETSSKDKFTVPQLGNNIVKGYKASYENFMAFDTLKQLKNLTEIIDNFNYGASLKVYPLGSRVIDDTVYKDDPKDTFDRYLKLNDPKTYEINSSNATIANGKVAPSQTSGNAFRQIVNNTLTITAKES